MSWNHVFLSNPLGHGPYPSILISEPHGEMFRPYHGILRDGFLEEC